MIVLNLDSDAIIFNNVYIYYMGERVDEYDVKAMGGILYQHESQTNHAQYNKQEHIHFLYKKPVIRN